jgi:hypothetical protein
MISLDKKNNILISLNNPSLVRFGNFAEIKLTGKDFVSNEYEVQLKISKEALIGFAIYALRTSMSYDETNRFHIHLDPLGNPRGNQPLGFFLTSESPRLIFTFNNLCHYEKYNEKLKNHSSKQLEINQNLKLCYQPELDISEVGIETHEIGFKNIAEITIFDNNEVDVTDNCIDVILEITKNGLIGLGHEFLRLAHIFRIGKSYPISQIDSANAGYDLGFHLLPDSCRLTVICGEFENIFSYEPYFGIN